MTRLFSIIFYWSLLSAVTLTLYVASFIPRGIADDIYFKFARYWCKVFTKALGVDLQLHFKNQSPLPNHYIVIANHPSSLEDFGIPAYFDVRPLAKEGVRHWFFIGRISYKAGAIFFDREDPESRHTAKTTMIDALNNGINIALFPEGGCKGRRIYKEFQTGAFDASLKTGTPIIPVFLHYEAQEAFEWLDPDTLLDNFWDIMTSRNNKAHYYVYDALDPKDFTDKEQYAEHAHSLYLKWQQEHLD